MNQVNNIAKNTSYLTLALILQKVISFTYFTVLARNLDPVYLGKYYLAISLTTIFAIFIDLGLVNVLTREVAKTPEKSSRLLGNVLSLKIPLSIFALLATIVTVHLLGYNQLTRQLVYISAISMILDSFTITFFSISRGHHNLTYESIASVTFQVIVMSFGFLALFSGWGLGYIMGALALASIFNFIYSLSILRFKIKIKIRLLYEKQFLNLLIKMTLPFAAYAILQRLYTYLDSVLLSVLAGEHFVGIYQVPFKIIFALQFLPLAFTASLYPALSYYWQHNKDKLASSFRRALDYLMIVSVPIVFGTIALADRIVRLFSSGYEEAVLPLQIIIVSLFFIFINYPIGSLLNACDKQKQNTRNMLITTVISIISNIILIYYWQVIGASITVLLTNFIMFVLGMYWVKKTITYKGKKNSLVFFKVLLASVVMGIVLYIGKHYFSAVLMILVGILIYFTLLYTLKGFTKQDIQSVYQSFAKKKAI